MHDDHTRRMPARPNPGRDGHSWRQPPLGALAQGQGQYQPQVPARQSQPQAPVPRRAQKIDTTGFESFWYYLGCIAFGASYFCKIPVKKALKDFGLVPGLTGAETFWYVLMNFAFGAGYFAKVIAAKAISELPQFTQARQAATIQAHTGAPLR
jgi:hypothetical protein